MSNQILCCECGVLIDPNPANTCIACIRTRVDITDGISKQSNLQWCKGCNRYMNHNNQYVTCGIDSTELLTICIKKLKGLNTIKIIDASFIWTEPHSKRIKVKMLIQKEVNGGALLQQPLTIEYIVMNQMCNDCHKREAKDFWKAVVQVRQKVDNKKTFYYLEQLMLKHKVTSKIINIKPEHGGLDFYFSTKDDARKFSEFIQKVIPCRSKYSQRLISHDIHNNTFNYKTTYGLEIIPVIKDSIVCFSPKLAHMLGLPGKNRIAICYKLTRSAHFIDPISLHTFEITSNMFANSNIDVGSNNSGNISTALGLQVICTVDKLSRFIVMETEKIESPYPTVSCKNGERSYSKSNSLLSLGTSGTCLTEKSSKGIRAIEEKFGLAECWLARDTEDLTNFGTENIFCRTHLGNVLHPGDYVLGLHMPTCNINNRYLDIIKETDVPDVILVKKIYLDDGTKKNAKKTHKKVGDGKRKRESSQNQSEDTMVVDASEQYDSQDEDIVNEDYNDIVVEIGEDNEFSNKTPKLSLQEMLEDFHME